MYQTINEGKAKVSVPKETKISKKLPVFYNPLMKFNRDISVLLLNCVDMSNIQIGFPLAGSGVRGVRFFKELDKGKIKSVFFNDLNENAIKLIKKNLKLNKIKNKFEISKKDANLFLLGDRGFDYIDIDPFGSPNPFLNNTILRISRGGILGITATDTAALTGTYIGACRRKYWAEPMRNELMHEIGVRILIRKVQLIGAQFDKALVPVYSYSKDHYFRVFFKCAKGKERVDKVLKLHGMFKDKGPMWLGNLWDSKLAVKMAKSNNVVENQKMLDMIASESKLDFIGFHDIHMFGKRYKVKIPKKAELISLLKSKGYKVAETHFRPNSLRSNIGADELLKILKKNKFKS